MPVAAYPIRGSVAPPCVDAYIEHFHHERTHPGKGNVLLLPVVSQDAERPGPMQRRERLGGLVKYDAREAS